MIFPAVEYVRPVSHAARWARRASLFSLFVAVGAWAAIRFGPLLQPHFLALYLIACLLAALGVLGGLVGLFNLWRIGARGGKASVAAIFLAIPVLAPGAYAAWRYQKVPVIYDVSTDLVDPPAWIRRPAYDQMWLGPRPPAETPEREAQYFAYPALIAHRYEGALDRVLVGARMAARDVGIKVQFEKLPEKKIVEPQPLSPGAIPVPEERPTEIETGMPAPSAPAVATIQGEVAGFLTGFRYDVVIRLKEDGDTTLADVRVAARYGRTDLGGSALVVDDFLKALDTELLGAAPR